ncbi:glucuronyl esterase domain-containing protein [Stieleria varia]|uniref:4-O-methyl-glucuronoyl methylesterase-like domain-containing protein n=1 Tax=Stieleria varia TaxID=2528005 RepID=A0A5C5ZVY0_9BACT|nr:acetylxylan esterase [Stieleria varia]TWT91255.1 hypothetical protein Pla52n_66670 [Stieleria varia]
MISPLARKSFSLLFLLTLSFVFLAPTIAEAQKFVANYDESKIPDYQLPDPLVTQAGEAVTTPEQWRERRSVLVDLFEKHVYGVSPKPCPIRHSLVSCDENALGGKAVRREVDVFFGESDDAHSMRLLIYTPTKSTGASAAFVGLNFQGNHTIDPDPSISITESWVRDRRDDSTDGHRATAAGRGVAASRWPVETIIDRGYSLVTIYYGDIDPDFDDGFQNGIHGPLGSQLDDVPQVHRWGSIAAWAYGLSRALDYLETDSAIDATRVAVIGHSRLGKTSLWAGASDPRFAMVISNDSGCGGAALSRRAIGETIGRINTSFPHWFCDQYVKYNENENACPVDQHELLALIAPRPLYVASATEDQWADPKGEFMSATLADPVYRLLGTDGMGGKSLPDEMPAADQPIKSGRIGYHLRTGKHDLAKYDWEQYLDFADKHLTKKE